MTKTGPSWPRHAPGRVQRPVGGRVNFKMWPGLGKPGSEVLSLGSAAATKRIPQGPVNFTMQPGLGKPGSKVLSPGSAAATTRVLRGHVNFKMRLGLGKPGRFCFFTDIVIISSSVEVYLLGGEQRSLTPKYWDLSCWL
ncbi:hypothetical protein NDU88_003552 [Pleurodeles waltl]|uniref:Uncharacterized protein n=1 Tax=Pleurodeles waltl TaxID=8319 RepID=A0AAV7M4Y8_PLEWA|nr:hypothetical protein NDU88_003550 [Pleurodeles waltl]KAJ1098441.1 hypothetical protein NDU88_003552 [Pleurodeles waltl]